MNKPEEVEKEEFKQLVKYGRSLTVRRKDGSWKVIRLEEVKYDV